MARRAVGVRPVRGKPPAPEIAADDLLALAAAPARRGRRRAPSRSSGVLREVIDTLDSSVAGVLERGRRGSLDEREAKFIDAQVRWLAVLTNRYFRGEVRHLERIRRRAPCWWSAITAVVCRPLTRGPSRVGTLPAHPVLPLRRTTHAEHA